MKKRSRSLILTRPAGKRDIGTALTVLIVVLAVMFAILPAGVASAANNIVITQSNTTIVMGNSDSGANSATVRVSVQPGDVVTVTLDHRL